MQNDEFLKAISGLEPVLSSSAKKSLQSIFAIVEAYPGKSLTEIAKLVGSLKKMERTTVNGMIDRAQKLCSGQSDENIEFFLKDFKGISTTDIKKIGKGLFLEFGGKKDEMLSAMRRWIESGGEIKPKTAAEKEADAALEYSQLIKDEVSNVTTNNVDSILEVVDGAYKALKVKGFEAFGKQIGITLDGTKAKMKKQAVDFIKSLAVSHTQTQF